MRKGSGPALTTGTATATTQNTMNTLTTRSRDVPPG
jgi:hypothetical protein